MKYDYQPRVTDQWLSELVKTVPATLIVGPKAVGKTESARRLARSMIDLSDPDEREIITADRTFALAHARKPVLIDEWQLDPSTWEAMRHAVDDNPVPGQFILTGSANPRHVRIHSGAGRVVRMRMRPMSLAERAICEQTVSLKRLWNGHGSEDVSGSSSLNMVDYAHEIVSSGFPAIRMGSPSSRHPLLNGYIDSIVEEEVPELGFTPRRASSLMAWLRAYAAASSTTAGFAAIADAISDEYRPSRTTMTAYRDVLEQLWMLDPIPAFNLGHNMLGNLGKAPKHQLADPALAAVLLGVDEKTLFQTSSTEQHVRPGNGPLLGALFESLAALCVRVYAQAIGLDVYHLRTQRGTHEVDLLLADSGGNILGIEVKLAKTASDDAVRHLHWLQEKIGDKLVDALVITTGTTAYRRPDGVAVVPLGLLGP